MSKYDIRYCCIHFPGFRLQVTELEHPTLAGKPFALAYLAAGALASVEALSVAARRLRIPVGISLVDLRSRWPNVSILAPNTEAEEHLQTILLSLADSQTPNHHWERDSLFLDLAGTQRLHGSDRLSWAKRFLGTITPRTGLTQFRTALANSQSTAELLAIALRNSAPTLCPPGSEREALATIPLRLLTVLEPRIHTRFHLYNLRSLGDLQKLDRRFLQAHFGAEGERLYAMAQGLDLCEPGRSFEPPTPPASKIPSPQIDLFLNPEQALSRAPISLVAS